MKPADPKAEHKQFSADISRLMKLIVNSLYSNKEIFLRELISNSADALNKVKMEAQINPAILGDGDLQDLEITVIPDEDAETLTIIDNGIGMSKEELMSNLGTIAHSGTLKFFEALANGTQENDLIGQFGVGFYSAFLVATRVEVTSRRYNTSQYVWTSIDAKSYTIAPDTKGEDLKRGTKVKLFLKDARYGNSSIIHALIDKYSRFIEFPIKLRVEKEDQYTYERRLRIEDRYRRQHDPRYRKLVEQQEEEEMEEEEEVDDDDSLPEPEYEFIHVNEQAPIWERNPESKKDEDYVSYTEYDDFFHAITYNRYRPDAPLGHFHYHSGSRFGEVPFKTLLYIPPRVPPGRNRWATTRVTQLRLYVKKVLVTEEIMDMLPDYLTFVRGVLEIEDIRDPLFSTSSTSKGESEKQMKEKKKAQGKEEEDDDSILLNVSREMLQKSEALKQISKQLTKLIVNYLVEFSDRARKDENDEDVEAYDNFYREYARDIKAGIRDDNTYRKDLAKLLRFNSTMHEEKLISIDDYLEETTEHIKALEEQEKRSPETSKQLRKGRPIENLNHFPILYYAVDTDDVDAAMSFVRESPFVQPFIADQRNVLLLFDPYDEAILIRVMAFSGHPITSVQDELKNRVKEFEERGSMKKRFEQWRKELKPLVNWMSSVLAGKVDSVQVSSKLAMGDFEKALEHEKERRMDDAERERLKEKAEKEKERFARRRRKQEPKGNNDNGVVIATKSEVEEEERMKKWRKKHPSLLYKLKKEREEAEKEGRTISVLQDRVSLKKSVPVAVVSAEGGLSAGLNRLYYDHPDVTESMKKRMQQKSFEINPVSPLIQRLNKAYTAIQAKRAKELEEQQQKTMEESDVPLQPVAGANDTNTTNTPPPPPPSSSSEEDIEDQVDENGEPTTAAQMKKLEKLLLAMYETALLHDGYVVKEKINYAERLYDVISTMTGLPHAPVLPDDVDEDFDEWLEKEVEEEKELREIEREQRKKKHQENLEKRLEAQGENITRKANGTKYSFLPDTSNMTAEEKETFERKLRKFERKKAERDKKRREREERKKQNNRPSEEYFEEDEEDDEDPEEVLQRELEQRKEMRKRRAEARQRHKEEEKEKEKEKEEKEADKDEKEEDDEQEDEAAEEAEEERQRALKEAKAAAKKAEKEKQENKDDL